MEVLGGEGGRALRVRSGSAVGSSSWTLQDESLLRVRCGADAAVEGALDRSPPASGKGEKPTPSAPLIGRCATAAPCFATVIEYTPRLTGNPTSVATTVHTPRLAPRPPSQHTPVVCLCLCASSASSASTPLPQSGLPPDDSPPPGPCRPAARPAKLAGRRLHVTSRPPPLLPPATTLLALCSRSPWCSALLPA